ncbi:MAG: NAD(P)H-dependent oxidoreductase [Bdellovibrionales bacterium]|nr:NAD(P)H-dependent oxidoreductase [Bdellovibrionales bacterium]
MGIYHIDASSRSSGSTTRAFSKLTVEKILSSAKHEVTYRDLGKGLGLKNVDDIIASALFIPDKERSPEQKKALEASDKIIEEATSNDLWVVGLPIYNFAMPGAMKTWADMLARSRKTCRYTESGPEGLLTNKKAIVIISSGGTEADSEIDFCTPWVRHYLKFLGVEAIIVKADRFSDEKREEVLKQIEQAVSSL